MVLVVGLVGPHPRAARGTRRRLALGLSLVGIATIMGARRNLGSAFSVFPVPVPEASVADEGAYRYVRHPMYSGVLAQAIAISTAGSPWAIVPTGVLAVVLDRKAAYEEALLADAHPEFASYRSRTPWRFVPGVR